MKRCKYQDPWGWHCYHPAKHTGPHQAYPGAAIPDDVIEELQNRLTVLEATLRELVETIEEPRRLGLNPWRWGLGDALEKAERVLKGDV